MGKTILLGVTGSIASFKSCDLIGLLRKKGYTVRCVMSADAKWFVTPLTLETLTGQKVADDMFRLPDNRDPAHVSLADEAELILIAPATADIIGKLASGICDDILTCTVCASGCPVILAPAMNDKMFNNPIIQDKIEYLKEKGYHFIGPVVGHLACGREGIGHLAPLEEIVRETERILKMRV
ncbi:MAG: flavoprotein [Candidatus Omnitrophota bacterium]|nr:flavoprotein [Candidatus Omnitrophota bacterium]